VISTALYSYSLRQGVAVAQVCTLAQIGGGGGFVFSDGRVVTARHVLGMEDGSRVGQFKLGYLGNEIIMMKCLDENSEEIDIAYLEVIYRYPWKTEERRQSSHESVDINIAPVRLMKKVVTYGYPSILLNEGDFGSEEDREGEATLVTVENERYVAWEPPMWNMVDSNVVVTRLRTNRSKSPLKSNYTAFYHGAIRSWGFSGAPLFQDNKLIGIHNGWDDEVVYCGYQGLGMAVATSSIPEISGDKGKISK